MNSVSLLSQFDRDAEDNELSRRAALKQMAANEDPLIRDRGATMSNTIMRSKNISAQLKELEKTSEIARPFVALKAMDTYIAQRTVDVFRPAVPLTFSGLIYGLLGLIVFGLPIWLVGGLGQLFPWRKTVLQAFCRCEVA